MGFKSDVDNILQQAVSSGDVPGVVAVAGTSKGETYHGAFGERGLGQANAMTVDSVFWIASMTKAITAAAAMQLAEQGKLSLDEPISRILPQYSDMKVLEQGDNAGSARLRPAKSIPTPRQLLTHTAGFCYEIWNEEMGRYMTATGIPGIISCKHESLTAPLASDPGTRWEYGINIDIVGKAIEAVSGKKLGVYFKENLFEPLGMRDTAFKITPEMRNRLVDMHARGADNSLQVIPFEIEQTPDFEIGGAGLYGTARDYLAFTRMILNRGVLNGNRVLESATVEAMLQNHIGDLDVEPLRTAIPPYSNDFDLYPDQAKKWGLSFLINTQTSPEGRSAGSSAWAGLANTYYWIDPVRDITGVIMMQILPFADRKAIAVFNNFERSVYMHDGGISADK